jgi:predicted site-specific integrase-resolvase
MSGGAHVPPHADRDPADGRDADGTIWFTVPQAAAFLGCNRQTIYSWERRGHLTNPRHDEEGRRIYTQQQIAAAHHATRRNARAVQRRAAA